MGTRNKQRLFKNAPGEALSGKPEPFLKSSASSHKIGVERYHADLQPSGNHLIISRMATRWLLPRSIRLTQRLTEFSDIRLLQTAIRQSQRNEHTYLDFDSARRRPQACVKGYFVQITGRRVIYFGRNGESPCRAFPASTGQHDPQRRIQCPDCNVSRGDRDLNRRRKPDSNENPRLARPRATPPRGLVPLRSKGRIRYRPRITGDRVCTLDPTSAGLPPVGPSLMINRVRA